MPSRPGTYDLRLFANNGYDKLGQSGAIEVQAAVYQTRVTASPAVLLSGGDATVQISEGPGNRLDWVGVYESTSGDEGLIDWRYLNGSNKIPPAAGVHAATIPFPMPSAPGSYNFRLFANDSYSKLATSDEVRVIAPTVTVSATAVMPGQPITVSVNDGPGNPADWLGLGRMGENDHIVLDWAYLDGTYTVPISGLRSASVTFTMPMEPGRYVFRLFIDDSLVKLVESPVVSSGTAGGIGAPCIVDSDCLVGATKKCWRQNILEEPGNLATPGGYCTAQCTTDDDCAGQGMCASVAPGQPKYCLQKCSSANVCRHPDYACFVLTSTSGYCWPTTRLSCNPTLGDGICHGADPAAACIRRAFEDLGECRQVCNLGPNTCPFLQNGRRQHCVYINATRDTQGLPTRDKYKGTACFELYKDAKRENDSCTAFDECQDGLQCNLGPPPTGDQKCHPLCPVGGATCSDPNQMCTDVFDAGPGNPGLCLNP